MTVAVAVSGGADSLLALARSGPEKAVAVHGLFLDPDPGREERIQRLEKACRALGAELRVADLRREFAEAVVEPFVRFYLEGLTPNPCAACNRFVKFGLLAEAALRVGAESYATGHFVSLRETPWGRLPARGADPEREQSYFLALVPAEGFARAVFPLGGTTKDKAVAELARMGVVPPLSAASREICFVPNDDYRAFLAGRRGCPPGSGPVRLPDGTRLGTHQGLWRYTVGQRRGLGIPYARPLYVLAKDTGSNTLVVGPRELSYVSGAVAGDFNCLVPPDQWPERVFFKCRYRQAPRPGAAAVAGGVARVRFEEPGDRPAPGQVMALYHENGLLLGGGTIREEEA